jgi:hypothetical protein
MPRVLASSATPGSRTPRRTPKTAELPKGVVSDVGLLATRGQLMRSLHGAAPIIAAVLALSCTERTAPPDAAPPAPPVSFDFLNGPDSPGNSGIFRFQDVVFEIAVDESAGLVSLHGLLNTVADLCADLGEFDLMDLQLKPHSAEEVNSLIVDRESPVQILALPAEGVSCESLSGAPVLYSGTATFRETDNMKLPLARRAAGRTPSVGPRSECSTT